MSTVYVALLATSAEIIRKNRMRQVLKRLPTSDKIRLQTMMMNEGILFDYDNWEDVYIREKG